MHILECEHPKRIYNKYTQDWCYVPCGKCPSCRRSVANKWIERLNVERKCWKYCLFFTLTYSNEFVPTLKKIGTTHLADLSHLHQRQGVDSPCIDLEEVMFKLSDVRKKKLSSFLEKNDTFTYLSVYDAQCFIKRLRKNLYTTIKNTFSDYDQKDYQVRYYLIGEYGSTTKRSHYHGLLFFSSEKEASCIESVISKSWQFGFTDTSFVSGCNAGYLASYLNCLADLPEIYEHPSIRPFSIFSKGIPIGTLYFDEEEVRKIYDTASPTHLVDYFKGLSLDNAPIWRFYQDRLFPKISFYSRLTDSDRVILYRAYANLVAKLGEEMSSVTFADFMLDRYYRKKFDRYYLHCYDDYIDTILQYDCCAESALKRWCFVSHRVMLQAAAFDVSIESYCAQINLYYEHCEEQQLQRYYNFQQNYAEKSDIKQLLGLDKLWLESMLDVLPEDWSEEEKLVLEGYDIDFEKFTSQDLTIKLPYQEALLPESTRDYQDLIVNNAQWLKKKTKTKIKNDYLQEHQDMKYKMSDYLPF